MKNVILTIMFFCFIGATQANLLSNGDFGIAGSVPDDALGWNEYNSLWVADPPDMDAWVNRETQNADQNPPYGDTTNFHMSMGYWGGYGAFIWQDVSAFLGIYKLSTDASLDDWWMNSLYIKIEFYNAGGVDDPNNMIGFVESDHYTQPDYDVGLPWTNYSITGDAPVGTEMIRVLLGSYGEGGSARFDNAVLELLDVNASDPYPANAATGVALDDTTLSWKVNYVPDPVDPNFVILDPNMVSYDLYFDDDPNLADEVLESATDITNWADPDYRASHTLTDNYDPDGRYFWRVDMNLDTGEVVTGTIWTFEAILSIPEISAQPAPYTLVEPGDPINLSATAESVSTGSYQWYKDGTPVGDPGTLVVGTTVATYSVGAADAGGAHDGSYICEFDNNAPGTVVTDVAVVGTKREIAHWDFETDFDSTIADSPTSNVNESPVIIGGGISGNAAVFDANDMLYTDPNETYFDICNYNMTVGCWIKSDSNDVPEWSPLVARNGEEDGWQLRRGNVGAIGDQRVRFTTLGLTAVSGGTDGSASLDTPFDEQWHYVVATYDGASRKVYVDGIVQLVWWIDDGAPQSAEGDDATGTITPSASGVSIAGRYGQNPAQVDDQFIAGTYDEVEIWNYARSAAEIAQTYATLTNTPVCPVGTEPAYDLDGDCIVDLNDFAKLASEWLTDTSVQP